MMAFGDQPVAMVDLKPFQRMDTGFGILTAPLTLIGNIKKAYNYT